MLTVLTVLFFFTVLTNIFRSPDRVSRKINSPHSPNSVCCSITPVLTVHIPASPPYFPLVNNESLLDHRSNRSFFSPGSSTSTSSVRSLNPYLHDNLRYRGVESDLGVSFVNNELVGPYSTTVLIALSSAPDHRPPHLASARRIPSPLLTSWWLP
ncbi:hypothetical protein TNCV_627031 [Trichonephila clavipes]|nr:hypothetical protein TNCV_627031 [Trichonephila clavipes]